MHTMVILTNKLTNAKREEIESAERYKEWAMKIQSMGIGKPNQQMYISAAQKLNGMASQELEHAKIVYSILEDVFGYSDYEIEEISHSIGINPTKNG